MNLKEIEELLPLSLVSRFGDEEIKNKVFSIINGYKKAMTTGENQSFYSLEVVERDKEEEPNKFDSLYIEYNDGQVAKRLEICSNFDLTHGLFKNTLSGMAYNVVTLEEFKPKSFMGERVVNTLLVERTDDYIRPNIITKRGEVFKGLQKVKVFEKVEINEPQNE